MIQSQLTPYKFGDNSGYTCPTSPVEKYIFVQIKYTKIGGEGETILNFHIIHIHTHTTRC